MKTLRNQVKKGMAFLLVAVMTVSLLPLAPKSMAIVQAADDTEENAPSVTAFATKEELMTSFTPNDDGTATTIGKIVFGKDSSGNPLEWYILGEDSGVEGDNIAIFTASPIATGQLFESDWKNNKTFESSFGAYANNPAEVYPNHYGASDFRVALKGMLKDNDEKIVTTYFTEAEQSLMQATTVTTYDTNKEVNYTISDVLYALTADGYGDSYKTIKAGSKNNIILAMDTYWSNSSDNWFWLRMPCDFDYYYAVAAAPGYYVGYSNVDIGTAVRPASNLDLSSVIFASAAAAATSDTVVSETIAKGTAMTLRVDASNKSIGNIVYNNSEGVILAAKDDFQAGKVSLVVQGNNGEKDWYYSKAIDGIEEIKADAIKTALSNAGISVSDLSLADCKIWLETTEDNVTYAKFGTEVRFLDDVAVKVGTPVGGAALDTVAKASESTSDTDVVWTIDGNEVTGNAEYNTAYTMDCTLTATEGCAFAKDVVATVNGNTTTVKLNADGTLVVSYTFPATAKGTISHTTTGYEGTYDGKSHGITIDVTSPTDAKITYSTDRTTYSAESPQFTDVGTYTVYYKIEKENYTTVEGSQTVTITASAKTTEGSGDTTISVAESEQKITQTNTDKSDPAGSAFYQLRLKATGKNKSVKLSWTKVKGADGYIIYGAKCGSKMKNLKTISASKKTYTVKKLKKGTYYKYIVSAYKLVDGEKRVIATSKSAHAVTTGGKYGNPTKVTYSKSKITLKRGKTKTLKPKLKYSKKLKTHIAKFRYESTDTSVATVNKNGKITAKKKGNCYVYIYAQNGVYKKITVKVK